MSNKVIETLYTFLAKIANEVWWPAWSNFRWRNSIRTNIEIPESDIIHNIAEVKSTAQKVYKVFTWTQDDISQLSDSIVPPPQNYQNYLDGAINDDCDGFHSTMYHFFYNSNIECYLLSVVAIGSSHCVLLFKLDGLWYVNDYTAVTNGYASYSEALDAYNKSYVKTYKRAKSEVLYNCLIKYDYSDGKFKTQNKAKLQ